MDCAILVLMILANAQFRSFTSWLDAITMDPWSFRPFVNIGRAILRDVEVFCCSGPLGHSVARLPSSWLSSYVPVFDDVSLPGAGMLTSLDTSVLFCCVIPQWRAFHYSADVAS
jgi:hypothetical protein